jgi:hypothetical protein
MYIRTVPRKLSISGESVAAFFASVPDLLPGGVSHHGIRMSRHWLCSKITHGLLPENTVVSRLCPVPIYGEQVGVLMNQRIANHLRRRQNDRGKGNLALSPVGHPGRNPESLPAPLGLIGKRELSC